MALLTNKSKACQQWATTTMDDLKIVRSTRNRRALSCPTLIAREDAKSQIFLPDFTTHTPR